MGLVAMGRQGLRVTLLLAALLGPSGAPEGGQQLAERVQVSRYTGELRERGKGREGEGKNEREGRRGGARERDRERE